MKKPHGSAAKLTGFPAALGLSDPREPIKPR